MCYRVLVLGAALVLGGCLSRPRAAAAPTAREATQTKTDELSPTTVIPPSTPDCDVASEAGSPADRGEEGDDHSTIDDGIDLPPAEGGTDGVIPFAELSDAEISSRLKGDIGALGPISIGRAHGGVLVAGVRMPEGANWEVVHPTLAWGTKETVDALSLAIDAVAAKFPNTPKAFIGDISARQGGHLAPHVSHQSGRDVDLGYYLTEGSRWYTTATSSNLDRARTWHLVRTLIASSDVELILVDLQVQRLLKAYALELGEDAAWLDQVFQAGGRSQRPLIFHAKGHATHLHVRFYSPAAQELGRRAYRLLLARRLLSPPTLFVTHTVKAGETLSHLALRYKVTPEAIKKANALTRDVLKVNKPYKIPQVGGIAMPSRVAIPSRRVPPPVKTMIAGISGQPCRRASAQ